MGVDVSLIRRHDVGFSTSQAIPVRGRREPERLPSGPLVEQDAEPA
jgi:hypothetical protein